MSDLTARRWTADSDEEFGGDLLRWNENVIAQVTGEESDGCMEAYAALVKAVASMDQIEALEAENARLRSYWAAHVDFGGDRHFVKPGQAVRPDGVVCDLVEATDENTAFTRSHVIDRITTDRAWILRPVVLPESGTP